MNDKIKEILGNELSDQIIQKLGDVQLGIVNDGSLVPAEKHENLKKEYNQAKEELLATKNEFDGMNSKIEELSKNTSVNEELKLQLEEANNKYKQFEAETEKRILNMNKINAITEGLRSANANPDIVDILVKEFDLDSITLDKSNNIVDWETHLNPLKEQRKTLFGEVKLQGDTPNAPKTNTNMKDSLIAKYNQAEKNGDVLAMQDLHNQIRKLQ